MGLKSLWFCCFFKPNNEVEPHVKIMLGMLCVWGKGAKKTKSNDFVKSFWYFLLILCFILQRCACVIVDENALWISITIYEIEFTRVCLSWKPFLCYLLRAFFYVLNDLWVNLVRSMFWCLFSVFCLISSVTLSKCWDIFEILLRKRFPFFLLTESLASPMRIFVSLNIWSFWKKNNNKNQKFMNI